MLTYGDLIAPIYYEDNKTFDTVVCVLCNLKVACKDSNIRNFKSHLQNNHPEQLTMEDNRLQYERKSSGSRADVVTSINASCSVTDISKFVVRTPKSKDDFTTLIATYIVETGTPIHAIVNPFMKNLFKQIQPNCIIADRRTIRKTALKIIDSNDKRYCKNFKKLLNGGFISLTTDACTSKASVPYICTTFSIITKDWKMLEVISDVCLFDENHTGLNLASKVNSMIKEFCKLACPLDDVIDLNKVGSSNEAEHNSLRQSNEVEELFQRVSFVTTDKASNNTQYTQEMLKCFGHRLNTYLEKIIDGNKNPFLAEIVKMINTVCSTFKNSNLNRKALAKVQVGMGMKELMPYSFRLDSTRWTAVPTVVARGSKLFDSMRLTFESRRRDMYLGQNKEQGKQRLEQAFTEWGIKRDVILFIQPYLDRIKYWIIKTEAGSYPTISLVLYALNDLSTLLSFIQEKVNKANDLPGQSSDYKSLLECIDTMGQLFNETFKSSEWQENEILLFANVLDIRTLRTQRSVKPRQLKSVFDQLYLFCIDKKIFEEENTVDDIRMNVEDDASNIFTALSQDFRASSRALKTKDKYEEEISKYFQTIAKLDEKKVLNEDPLQYWAVNETVLPMLAKAARAILCICAQAASSKRVWSRLAYIINKLRCRMDKHFAAKLVKSSMRSMMQLRQDKESNRKLPCKPFPPFGKCYISAEALKAIFDDIDERDEDYRLSDEEDSEYDSDDDEDDEYVDESDLPPYAVLPRGNGFIVLTAGTKE